MPVGVRGRPWAPVGTREHSWAPVDTRGHPWTPVGTRGYPWASMGVPVNVCGRVRGQCPRKSQIMFITLEFNDENVRHRLVEGKQQSKHANATRERYTIDDTTTNVRRTLEENRDETRTGHEIKWCTILMPMQR